MTIQTEPEHRSADDANAAITDEHYGDEHDDAEETHEGVNADTHIYTEKFSKYVS